MSNQKNGDGSVNGGGMSFLGVTSESLEEPPGWKRTSLLPRPSGMGLVGQAFALDGHGDFVDLPDGPALNVRTEEFTFELWGNFNTTAVHRISMVLPRRRGAKWMQLSGRRSSRG